MNLNLSEAFNFYKNDNNIIEKFGIAYSIFAISALINIVFILIAIIIIYRTSGSELPGNWGYFVYNIQPIIQCVNFVISIVFCGYYALCANLKIFKPEAKLIEWKNNWKNIIITGLKTYIVIFLASLIIFFPLFIILLIVFAISFGLIFGMTHALSHSDALNACIILSIIIGSISFLIVYFLATYFLTIAEMAFYTNLKFESFMNVKLLKTIGIKNFKTTFTSLLVLFLLTLAVGVINLLLLVTIIGIFLLPIFNFYFGNVRANILAQIIRNTVKLEEIEKENQEEEIIQI